MNQWLIIKIVNGFLIQYALGNESKIVYAKDLEEVYNVLRNLMGQKDVKLTTPEGS